MFEDLTVIEELEAKIAPESFQWNDEGGVTQNP